MRKILGKVPTYALLIGAVVLIAAIVVLMEWKLIRPQKEELAQLQEQLAAEEQVAAQRPQAEAELAEVQADWLQAQVHVEELQKYRSFPISMYQPIGAMIAMWYEYREDLPRVTKEWIDSTGITLNSAITFPTPEMGPPAVPAGGFISLPGPISLNISGTLNEIEGFYNSLANYKRIITVGGLQLAGEADTLTATVPVSIYLLVEAPASAPAPAAAGDPGMFDEFGPGPPPMGPGMDPGMEPGMEPGMDPGMDPGMVPPPPPADPGDF
ncbi:MAG: type 4a pilus biogenesis protein PilO [candidate division WS1 bacterium]|jgi:Tfp pilus assembly protein PilO|nr:type 4a pilus biogenesis protein PilO [candidate division WS1 bacterium]